MNNLYADIQDIAFINSLAASEDVYRRLFTDHFFNDPEQWEQIKLNDEIPCLRDGINSRLKYSMSMMSLGIFQALDTGPYRNLSKSDEIFLFSGFTEIETINKIGKLIMEENYVINPALFPNSVHHVALSYFSILKKITNYTVAIYDGLNTNYSFINFISERIQLPGNFVITSGEESSNFFSYDIKRTLEIVPSFTAYKVIPGQKKGFRYINEFTSFDAVLDTDYFKQASSIFCDQKTFKHLVQQKYGKPIYSEYPIVKDNPCGIISRLALPFYFQLKGKSLVIEPFKNNFHLFEVVL